MPKHVIKDNTDDKWKDQNNGNAEYHGHVAKDLAVGDMFDQKDRDGSTKTYRIADNTILDDGTTVVHSIGV